MGGAGESSDSEAVPRGKDLGVGHGGDTFGADGFHFGDAALDEGLVVWREVAERGDDGKDVLILEGFGVREVEEIAFVSEAVMFFDGAEFLFGEKS